MHAFNATFPHLAAAQGTPIDGDVGKTVRYVIPKDREQKAAFLRTYGTVARDSRFQIIGAQLDFMGRLSYRAKAIDCEDDFGRCISPDVVEFV